MWVGKPEHNTYWTGISTPSAVFGQSGDGRMLTTLDLVGHELGHSVDQFTPGGPSGKGTGEFIGDAFGTATEWYAHEPAGYDTADYVVGDGLPEGGRHMYDPAGHTYPLRRTATARAWTPRRRTGPSGRATTGSTCWPRIQPDRRAAPEPDL